MIFSSKRFFPLILAILLLGMLSGCGQQRAPDVRFTDLQGQSVSLSQLKGKVLMVNFWATSCTTCVGEMPEMIKIYEQYHAKGLEFVAVAMSYDPPNYVLNFSKTRQLPFRVALDLDGKLAQAFGQVSLTPTTFVIDKQGVIIKKYVGAPEFSGLRSLLDQQTGA